MNSRRRINTTHFSGGNNRRLDNKGKFMRDIVSTAEAVELAFSKCKEAEHVSATTLVLNNSRMSN